LKYNVDDSVDRYKVWIVAKGYKQQVGIDFSDTFSLMDKLTFLRVLLVLVAYAKNWSQQHLDTSNAFLNHELFKEVYMDIPPRLQNKKKRISLQVE